MRITYNDLEAYIGLISRLYRLTLSFIEYYNNVIKQSNGKNIYEVSEEIRSLVLSGLRPDGEYTENAYALFIKDFMGLGIEDPKLYVSKLRLGAEPDVKIVAEESRFVEFVKTLNSVSKFILDKTRALNIGNVKTNVGEVNIGQENIENLIAELIKTSYDLSVGVHNFSTSVWGLRKITPHYMRKAYENISENLLKFLGFSKLIEVKDYELWGFPDYFTKCTLYKEYVSTPYGGYNDYYISVNGIPTLSKSLRKIQAVNPIKPETLGGAICILNEIIWRYNDLLYESLSKWYNGSINIEEKYVEEAWKSLSDIEWNIPEYLGAHGGLYTDFKELLRGYIGSSRGSPFKFLLYDKDGIISKYIQWIYRGSYDRSGFSEYKLSHYILLPELFDDLMPAIFLGVIDTTLYLNDRKALLILVRTTRGR